MRAGGASPTVSLARHLRTLSRRKGCLPVLALALLLVASAPMWAVTGDLTSRIGSDCAPPTRGAETTISKTALRELAYEGDSTVAGEDDRQFTLLLNTFKRRDLLKRAIKHYLSCDDVGEIRVVWSEPDPPPDPTDRDARLYYGDDPSKEVRYQRHPTTSIQNRFEPPSAGVDGDATSGKLKHTAVFNVDEDVRLPCKALTRGFDAWRANREQLVGFYPRNHVRSDRGCGYRYAWNDLELWRGGEFSIILTKAAFMHAKYLNVYSKGLPREAREYIDRRKNCEDIAMQILVTKTTGIPPVYKALPMFYYVWAKLGGIGVPGISKNAGHHDERGACVTDLSRMIGAEAPGTDTPLLRAPLKEWRRHAPGSIRAWW